MTLVPRPPPPRVVPLEVLVELAKLGMKIGGRTCLSCLGLLVCSDFMRKAPRAPPRLGIMTLLLLQDAAAAPKKEPAARSALSYA